MRPAQTAWAPVSSAWRSPPVVVIDGVGIARTAKRLGGEGTNILCLKSSADFKELILDGALPPDDGESPANGGWFPGPRGWMLLVEGLDEVVNPWIAQLAEALTEQGIEGTLTGAGVASQPAWARRQHEMRSLHGLVGYTPEPGSWLTEHWMAGQGNLNEALANSGRWLAMHDANIMAVVDLRANLWVDRERAQQLMAADLRRNGDALATSFVRNRGEVRSARIARRAAFELGVATDLVPWQELVDDLRSALLSLRLERVSIAMVSHRKWMSLLDQGYGLHDGDPFNGFAYGWHPERWREFALEPCGIQILTNQHLAAANDLSGWRTTRLDDHHLLVEARDLEPWYSSPPKDFETLEQSVIGPAYADFGDMILTPDRAQALDLHVKPDYQRPLP